MRLVRAADDIWFRFGSELLALREGQRPEMVIAQDVD